MFTTHLRAGGIAAFALRHDVDAIVWDLDVQDKSTTELSITHKYTLHAFGFIQVCFVFFMIIFFVLHWHV